MKMEHCALLSTENQMIAVISCTINWPTQALKGSNEEMANRRNTSLHQLFEGNRIFKNEVVCKNT